MNYGFRGGEMFGRISTVVVLTLVLVTTWTEVSSASDALIWPSDPLVLNSAGGSFNTVATVTNPTDVEMTVNAPNDGPGPANACKVSITSGEKVPANRTSSVSITVAPVEPSCSDPADGTHTILLSASNGIPPTPNNTPTVELAIKEGAAAPEEPKPTGLIWPTKPIFVKRRNGELMGTFTVVNPTGDVITVTPPVFGEGCDQVPPGADTSVTVPVHDATPITFTGPTDCKELNVTTLVATAVANAQGSTKTDVGELTLQAEVDWGRFGWVLGISSVAGLLIALVAALVTSVKLREPLRIDNTAPTSWLTSIAAVGSLVTALVSTTGLPEGLFGSDALPQLTLILGAAAVAALFVSLAGLVTGLPLAHKTVDGKSQTCPRAWQFAIGAGLSAAAAVLEIWAVTTALSRLDLPVVGVLITGAQIVALVVAGCYLAVSVYYYVKTYGVDPTKADPEPSEELVQSLFQIFLGPLGPTPNDKDLTEAHRKADTLAHSIAKEVAVGVSQPGAGVGARVAPAFTRSLI